MTHFHSHNKTHENELVLHKMFLENQVIFHLKKKKFSRFLENVSSKQRHHKFGALIVATVSTFLFLISF